LKHTLTEYIDIEIDASDLRLIGEGGTRNVYTHPRFPGKVLKIFKKEPGRDYWSSIFDNREFAGFLVAEVDPLVVLLRRQGESSIERAVLQPRCDAIGDSISVSLSYWELQPGYKSQANASALDVAAGLAANEPAGPILARACSDSPRLRTRLSRLHRAISSYATRTGCIVDWVGDRNVLLFDRNGEWDLQAIDLLKGDPLDPLNPPSADRQGLDMTVRVLNACAFLRMMFFIEHILGTRQIARRSERLFGQLTHVLETPPHRVNLDQLMGRFAGR